MRKLLISTIGLLGVANLYGGELGPVSPTYNWTGFYVGGNLGGAWSRVSAPIMIAPIPIGGPYFEAYNESPSSLTGGGQFGYLTQNNHVVLGGEVNVNSQRVNGSYVLTNAVSPYVVNDSFLSASNVQASALGRFGYGADKWLFYVTGGVNFTNIQFTANFIPEQVGNITYPAAISNEKHTLVGGVGGGGVEYQLYENWRIGIEGRYSDYKSQQYDLGLVAAAATLPSGFIFSPTTATVHLHTATALLKVNYRFDTKVSPF